MWLTFSYKQRKVNGYITKLYNRYIAGVGSRDTTGYDNIPKKFKVN